MCVCMRACVSACVCVHVVEIHFVGMLTTTGMHTNFTNHFLDYATMNSISGREHHICNIWDLVVLHYVLYVHISHVL